MLTHSQERRLKKKAQTWRHGQQPNLSHTIGWCKYHRWRMTAKSTELKQCLKKGCWYYRKMKDHPYWKEGEPNAKTCIPVQGQNTGSA
jgi:hypothetical protein